MNRFLDSKMSRDVSDVDEWGGTWTQIAYDPRGEIGGSCRQNIFRKEKYRKKYRKK